MLVFLAPKNIHSSESETSQFHTLCATTRRVWSLEVFPKKDLICTKASPGRICTKLSNSVSGRRHHHLWQIFGDRLKSVGVKFCPFPLTSPAAVNTWLAVCLRVGVGLKGFVIYGRPFVQRFAQRYRTVVLSLCPVCNVGVGYCGQTAGWIKMLLGREVGFGPGDIVLDGDPAPPQKGAQFPNFRPMSVVAKPSPISATAEHLSYMVRHDSKRNV